MARFETVIISLMYYLLFYFYDESGGRGWTRYFVRIPPDKFRCAKIRKNGASWKLVCNKTRYPIYCKNRAKFLNKTTKKLRKTGKILHFLYFWFFTEKTLFTFLDDTFLYMYNFIDSYCYANAKKRIALSHFKMHTRQSFVQVNP